MEVRKALGLSEHDEHEFVTDSIKRLVSRLIRCQEAIRMILPLAKGYRPEGQTDTAKATCAGWIEAAETALEESAVEEPLTEAEKFHVEMNDFLAGRDVPADPRNIREVWRDPDGFAKNSAPAVERRFPEGNNHRVIPCPRCGTTDPMYHLKSCGARQLIDSEPQCGMYWHRNGLPCILSNGHGGLHRDTMGAEWDGNSF